MPIVDVEVVGPVGDGIQRGLAKRIADAFGAELNSPPQGTWVKVRFLDERDYAENGPGPPDGGLPVFVSVLLRERPERDALAQHSLQLAAAVADACGRPRERVHIVFEPAALGRVAFGGHLQS